MAVHKGSRYETTRIYNYIEPGKGIVRILHRRKPLELPDEGEVYRHKVKRGETLDHLAYKYLDDAKYWWVILDLNPEYNAPWEIEPGDEIIIPTIRTLRRAKDGV